MQNGDNNHGSAHPGAPPRHTMTAAERAGKLRDRRRSLSDGKNGRRDVPNGSKNLGTYEATEQGIVWWKNTNEGLQPRPLTNFRAEILWDILRDDGQETHRTYELEVQTKDESVSFDLPAADFPHMNWVHEKIGSRAFLYPGSSIKDHARAAIQILSGDVADLRVYTHTGWRKENNRWVYLTGRGAIGADGLETDIRVDLEGLTAFDLPAPPPLERLRESVRLSMKFIELAADSITVPVYAHVWRAPLGFCPYSGFAVGHTGAGKTQLAALAQQHYGPTMTAENLPANWSSTGNALEGLAFTAKDALLVIDDFAPNGTSMDVQRLHREAERILRAQGNGAGRRRMNADTSLKTPKPPRGLLLCTGEDVPRGHSIRARMVISELGPGDLHWDKLTECQAHAAAGRYAEAMSGYVQWLAPRFDDVQASNRVAVEELRALARKTVLHKRTPDNTAHMGVGLRTFLDYALDVGAVTPEEHEAHWNRFWQALVKSGKDQPVFQASEDPALRFIELVASAIASGRAHVAGLDGAMPTEYSRWGWTYRETRGDGRSERSIYVPNGERIGWVHGNDLYLEPNTALAAVQRLAKDGAGFIPVTPQTLNKRLKQGGFLKEVDAGRQVLTVRRVIEGRRLDVLHLDAKHAAPLESDEKPDQPDRDKGQEQLWSGAWSGKPTHPTTNPTTENGGGY